LDRTSCPETRYSNENGDFCHSPWFHVLFFVVLIEHVPRQGESSNSCIRVLVSGGVISHYHFPFLQSATPVQFGEKCCNCYVGSSEDKKMYLLFREGRFCPLLFLKEVAGVKYFRTDNSWVYHISSQWHYDRLCRLFHFIAYPRTCVPKGWSTGLLTVNKTDGELWWQHVNFNCLHDERDSSWRYLFIVHRPLAIQLSILFTQRHFSIIWAIFFTSISKLSLCKPTTTVLPVRSVTSPHHTNRKVLKRTTMK
jgi:hypothetical protein